MPKFILEIELGNDAMRCPEHIRKALKDIAGKMASECMSLKDMRNQTRIRDVNGNTVGFFQVVE